MEMHGREELGALTAFSAAIGRDPLIVQAAGGNTSVKLDGRMWIKASGTWLADAGVRPIMVAVDLEAARDAVAGPASGARSAPRLAAIDGGAGLRPSVETAMHAVLPQRFVAHVHCVDTIAWSVQADARAPLAHRLDGLAWAFVPYVMPGPDLARAVRDRAAGADVLVLGNHGLVVAADTVADLDRRLTDVRHRLARPVDPRLVPPQAKQTAALAALFEGTGFRPAADPAAHGLAFADDACEIASAGTLYPDHAVFLGPAIAVAAARRDDIRAIAGISGANAVLIPGRGVGIREGALRGADALAGCLANVVARLRVEERIVYLADDAVAAICNWEAEHHRQAMNAAGAAAAP